MNLQMNVLFGPWAFAAGRSHCLPFGLLWVGLYCGGAVYPAIELGCELGDMLLTLEGEQGLPTTKQASSTRYRLSATISTLPSASSLQRCAGLPPPSFASSPPASDITLCPSACSCQPHSPGAHRREYGRSGYIRLLCQRGAFLFQCQSQQGLSSFGSYCFFSGTNCLFLRSRFWSSCSVTSGTLVSLFVVDVSVGSQLLSLELDWKSLARHFLGECPVTSFYCGFALLSISKF